MPRAEDDQHHEQLTGNGESFLPQVSDMLRQQLQEIPGVEDVSAYECFWSGCNTWDKAKIRYAKGASEYSKVCILTRMEDLGWSFHEDTVGILIFTRG